jgi:hypothetical protein
MRSRSSSDLEQPDVSRSAVGVVRRPRQASREAVIGFGFRRFDNDVIGTSTPGGRAPCVIASRNETPYPPKSREPLTWPDPISRAADRDTRSPLKTTSRGRQGGCGRDLHSKRASPLYLDTTTGVHCDLGSPWRTAERETSFTAKRKGSGIEKTESALRSFNPESAANRAIHSLAESFPHGEKPSQCRADHNR